MSHSTDIDAAYVALLTRMMVAIRLAIDDNDLAWCRAEIEFAHNVPSLIGEKNILRHAYFWNEERAIHEQWVARQSSERQELLASLFSEPLAALRRVLSENGDIAS